jgi:hypothetical protein
MKRISQNNDDLNERIIKGMDTLSDAINQSIEDVIVTPQQWPEGFGVTKRKSGEVVIGSFRNIKDLANLQKSQVMTREGFKTVWEWDGNGETPAVLVHEGYTLANGKRIPPRRFTEEGVNKVDIRDEFLKGFNS